MGGYSGTKSLGMGVWGKHFYRRVSPNNKPMGFNCGIVGLPNVGKSTIFNAMTAAHAAVSNYPFSTLTDERLTKLAELVKPEKVTETSVEFVDIAGLVRGASRGEGLGNQFLGHIRNVDVIAHIVRCFEDPQVVHVDGRVDPRSDIEMVETELMLADLETVTRRLEKEKKLLKTGDKTVAAEVQASEDVKTLLEEGRPARLVKEDKKELLRELNLLTVKPTIYVANVGEEDLAGEGPKRGRSF
jgi:GTP-binding protein YchF